MSKPKEGHERERWCPQCQRVMSGESYAFPFQVNVADWCERDYGLTKRELFAAMFCAAAIANPVINVPNVPIKAVVLDSITMADSLIAELNEPKEGV